MATRTVRSPQQLGGLLRYYDCDREAARRPIICSSVFPHGIQRLPFEFGRHWAKQASIWVTRRRQFPQRRPSFCSRHRIKI